MESLKKIHNTDLESKLGREMYKLVDVEAAHDNLFMPDYHGNVDTLRLGYEEIYKSNPNKRIYITLSDISEFSTRIRDQNLYDQLGVVGDQSLEVQLVASQLDNQDEVDDFFYVETIKGYGGIDNYLDLVSQQTPNLDEVSNIRKNYETAAKNYSESGLEDKVNDIKSSNVVNFQKYKDFNKKKNWTIEDSIIRYEAKNLANFIKEVNEGDRETVFLLGPGNHDTTSVINYVKEYVGNDDLVHNIENVCGWIELGGKGGEEAYKFQISGNIYGISQHAHNIIGYEEEDYLREQPHMLEDMAFVAQNFDFADIDKINPDVLMQSAEYLRLTNGGTESKDGHRLYVHMEFEGKRGPMGYRDRPSPYAKTDNIAVLKFADDYLLRDSEGFYNVESGHLHSQAQERDEVTKQDKSRAYISVLNKNERKILDLKPYTHQYDLEEIVEIAKPELIKLQSEFEELEAANDEELEDELESKAA
jgi:hypothetical protein